MSERDSLMEARKESSTTWEVRFTNPAHPSDVERLWQNRLSEQQARDQLAEVRKEYPHWTAWAERVDTETTITRQPW